MNEMIQKMISRHAIRKFQDRQIEESVLNEILTAGLYAPSAGNNQRGIMVVSQDREVNEKLGRLSRYVMFKDRDPVAASHSISHDQPSIQDDHTIMDGFYGAPTVITIFTRNGKYSHDDAAMMAENIWLAAHFLGVGACYIGRTDEIFETEYGRELLEKWGIAEDLTPVCNVLLGYREGPEPGDKPRKEGRILWEK